LASQRGIDLQENRRESAPVVLSISAASKAIGSGTRRSRTSTPTFWSTSATLRRPTWIALIRHAQAAVREAHGYELQPEIGFIGEF
jgi:hypothetical protein